MIISISGAPGSGKSTIGKKLANKLGWSHYCMGGIRREAAKKMRLTLMEYNKLGERDGQTDKAVDEYQKKLGLEKDNFIIEGRTSWYFIPHSFKIYLDVSLQEGAQRIHQAIQKDNSRNEDHVQTEEEMVESVRKRIESDDKRYGQYYNIDVNNFDNYDFYLDTSDLDINEVWDIVYKKIQKILTIEKNNYSIKQDLH